MAYRLAPAFSLWQFNVAMENWPCIIDNLQWLTIQWIVFLREQLQEAKKKMMGKNHGFPVKIFPSTGPVTRGKSHRGLSLWSLRAGADAAWKTPHLVDD